MKPNKLFLVVSLIALVYASLGRTQERATEKLGKVHFPVSCSAAAQEQFDRAVALLRRPLLHCSSCWFPGGTWPPGWR